MKNSAVLLIAIFALGTFLVGAAWVKTSHAATIPIAQPMIQKHVIPTPDERPVTPYRHITPDPVFDQYPATPYRHLNPDPVFDQNPGSLGKRGTVKFRNLPTPDNQPRLPYQYYRPERVLD